MKIYDISQEVFSCSVYPGDPIPKKNVLCSVEQGDVCNLSEFSMCAHNGTHLDAPYHFFSEGRTIDQIPTEQTVGYAFVAEKNGIITSESAENIISRAKAAHPDCYKKLLIKGDSTVSANAARVFAENGVHLVGGESQTVGPFDSPMEVHKILLGADAVLLEGLRLSSVPEGVYLLSAAPLSLSGGDGAPARALLIEI